MPYYYLHRDKYFQKAVIMHDSVFLQQAVDFDAVENLPLWHFDRPIHEDYAQEQMLLGALDNNEKLLKVHAAHAFRGAFGVMSVVTLDFVTRMETKYKVFGLLQYVISRPLRMALERVFCVLFTVENPAALSIFGNIHSFCPWGGTFHDYCSVQDPQNRKAIVKFWSGR